MKSNRMFRVSLIAVAIASLTACGGGGSSDPSDPAAPIVVSPTQTGTVRVRLASINLKASDTLVKTAPNTTLVSALGSTFTSMFAPAYAATREINVGYNNGFTNKLENGVLLSLRPVVVPADPAVTVDCDTSKAEVIVKKVWRLSHKNGEVVAQIAAPAKVTESCAVEYEIKDYVILQDGTAAELPLDVDGIRDVAPAGDPQVNTSESGLLMYMNGMVRAVEINGKSARLVDLTSVNATVRTGVGDLSYNGKQLFAMSNDTNGALLYENGTAGFKIFRPAKDFITGVAMIDGKFFMNEHGYSESVDPITGEKTEFVPEGMKSVEDWQKGFAPHLEFTTTPSPGARGTHGSHLLSDRCILWNWKTGQNTYLETLNGRSNAFDYYYRGTKYARLLNGKATCVNSSMTEYTQYDVDSGKYYHFNTDNLGYIPKSFEIYDTHALVEVVSGATADRMYVELNFVNGRVIDRGVIKAGDRKVVELIPIGG